MSLTRALAVLALTVGAASALAGPRLSLPADCTVGATCFVQQYPDTDPGPGAQDYMCGGLAYDGHKGTDFALPSLAAMRAGVAVLAPADGTVLRVRGDMADRLFAGDAAALDGRDCGNGVVLDHGDGWQTQLCHMRRGSLKMRPGDMVGRGAVLGLVGLSGRTQFPHVHLSLRRDGQMVDPFRPTGACGGAPDKTLWTDPPAYQPGGLLSAGFATGVPSYGAVRQGTAALESLPTDAPALVAWGYGFGSRAGDVMRLTIIGPEGETVFQHDARLERPQAQYFRAAGRKAHAGGWAPGRYTARAVLLREGAVIDAATNAISTR